MPYSRRLFLACTLAGALSLSGCGFRMRGHFSVPFSSIYLDMDGNTPFAARVRRLLSSSSDVKIVNTMKEAQAVLRIVSKDITRQAITYNADGDVREYEIRMVLKFRLTTPTGAEFLPDTALTATRDLYYSDDDYLTREGQEALLIKDMESDLADQMIRRIERAKPAVEPAATEEAAGQTPAAGPAAGTVTAPAASATRLEMAP